MGSDFGNQDKFVFRTGIGGLDFRDASSVDRFIMYIKIFKIQTVYANAICPRLCDF